MKPIKEAPYGSWQSPLSADMISAKAVRLEGVMGERDGNIYFSESRPFEKGRSVLVKMGPDGACEDLLPADYYARTTVHEYGGGSLLMVDEDVYFSQFSDQQLYHRDAQGRIQKLTNEENSRFADGCAFGDFLYYVMEVHGEKVENCLVRIDRKSGEVKRIAEGHDFYASPRINKEGKLAYYRWDHPNLPWDGGELVVAEVQEEGILGEERVVAGGRTESINQFAWGPDGLLYFTSDRSDWWNLYREKDGEIEPLYPMEADVGFPQWTFGQSFFAFWQRKVVFCYSSLGSDHLAILDSGQVRELNVPFTDIRGVYVAGDHLYFKGAAPHLPTCFAQYNLARGGYKEIRKAINLPVATSYLSTPQRIEFPTEGGCTAHAFYYPPHNPSFRGLVGELPPMIVLSHGGPTAHVKPSFNLEIQYWTSRGIAILDVNYGGSSGYGRKYRDRLNGNWGIVDVDDCTHGALYCTQIGLADPDRLAIAGGSAGGFTTLACLAFRDVFRAGASLFGVSDLELLVNDTHKFEARYLDNLVGPYPEARDIYLERAPIHHADQIKCPVILLQGDEDKIVPPPQSEKMYQSLLSRGIPTAYLLFANEQHGFRQSANIRRALEAEAYFFSQVFGFKLADPVEPVQIENLQQ